MVVFSTVWHRILELTGAKTDAELGDFLGITQAAVGKQRRKQKIPNTWYDVIRKKTGTTWEQLNAQPVAPVAPAVSQVAVANGHDNHVANSAQTAPVFEPIGGDEKRRNFDQTLTGWFAGVCDWWATEHGTDSSSPSAFFREFDRRFPEYVAWSRIEKK